jgi:hypothetical protein
LIVEDNLAEGRVDQEFEEASSVFRTAAKRSCDE